MSFDSLEESIDQGQPIHLYEFLLDTNVWRFCTAAKPLMTTDGLIWKPLAISDDGIKYSGEAQSDALNIQMPSSAIPAQIFMQSPPSRPMLVKISHMNIGSDERQVKYVGEITQHDTQLAGVCKLTSETLSATMKRSGLRLGWQKSCPYALYDEVTCKLPMEPLGVDVVVLEVDGFFVKTDALAAYPDGRFSGGLVRWVDEVRGTIFRQIESHSGFFIKMFGVDNDIVPGMRVRVYPGCARTTSACQSLGNYDNYGGIPNLPGRSPFDGNPVFY